MQATTPPDATPEGPIVDKHKWVTPVLAAVALLAIAATGIWWFGIRDTTDPAADLRDGMWVTEYAGVYLTFNEDGSWTAQPDLDLEIFRDAGAFTFDGEVLTVSTDPGFACAAYADEGSYELDFIDENTIRLTVIDDPCSGRAVDFAAGWVRYSP